MPNYIWIALKNNLALIKTGEYDVECDVYKHKLNKMEWRVGFTH